MKKREHIYLEGEMTNYDEFGGQSAIGDIAGFVTHFFHISAVGGGGIVSGQQMTVFEQASPADFLWIPRVDQPFVQMVKGLQNGLVNQRTITIEINQYLQKMIKFGFQIFRTCIKSPYILSARTTGLVSLGRSISGSSVIWKLSTENSN